MWEINQKFILLSPLSSAAGDRRRLGINGYYRKDGGGGGGEDREKGSASSGRAGGSRDSSPQRCHLLSPASGPSICSFPHRRAAREAWFCRSEEALGETALLVLDPDNGIQPETMSMTGTSAGKFALID
ncbi:MAG: hypothetical protein RQ758_02480 [Methanomicrobiaceae archaeon]|nr:hypothetical protein [Methanomicrobiaceae archaeon]